MVTLQVAVGLRIVEPVTEWRGGLLIEVGGAYCISGWRDLS